MGFGRNKLVCEICGLTEPKAIEWHHIIPKTDSRCTNSLDNIAFICGSCHNLVHAGEVIIEGVFATTGGTLLITHHKSEPYSIRPGVHLRADGTAEIIEAEG